MMEVYSQWTAAPIAAPIAAATEVLEAADGALDAMGNFGVHCGNRISECCQRESKRDAECASIVGHFLVFYKFCLERQWISDAFTNQLLKQQNLFQRVPTNQSYATSRFDQPQSPGGCLGLVSQLKDCLVTGVQKCEDNFTTKPILDRVLPRMQDAKKALDSVWHPAGPELCDLGMYSTYVYKQMQIDNHALFPKILLLLEEIFTKKKYGQSRSVPCPAALFDPLSAESMTRGGTSWFSTPRGAGISGFSTPSGARISKISTPHGGGISEISTPSGGISEISSEISTPRGRISGFCTSRDGISGFCTPVQKHRLSYEPMPMIRCGSSGSLRAVQRHSSVRPVREQHRF